ncbi:hypothetical protein [Streptomyces sp. NPDC001604]|uniref:hypothetical protein n=1 Tax=Streptomyces sp. NPDC001604 TaxID=3364593 RepID=UPI00368A30D1
MTYDEEPYHALPAPETTGKELFRLGRLRDAPPGSGTLRTEDPVLALGAGEVIASGGGVRNPGAGLGREGAVRVLRARVSDPHGLAGTRDGLRLPPPGARAPEPLVVARSRSPLIPLSPRPHTVGA